MPENNTSLDQLKSFLNQLFQFDSQDLDFGVYKILHYKKKEIATFIDQLLVTKVKAALQTLSADEAKQVQDQITEMEKSTSLKKWLEAVEKKDETRLAIYEEDYKEEIVQYKELKAKETESSVSVETENQIYNHLTLFFSRYYDKGDFISKRRFGKNEKYVVPYNGEETHFHWANQDQYYIKSSETFNQYAFKVPTSGGELVINFKLTEAQIEQGNVKESENNYFILSEKEADINNEEATFYFEYRALNDEEKKRVKGNSKQDTLDDIAFDALKKKFGTNPEFANLWKEQEGKPLLLKKLQHYTRKNKYDFFIHKNLKGFLERELDYYIKSELINVDDLYVTDTDAHFDRLKHNLKTIKVFKSIADTIIEFVSQIEDFQKKLWEKKKFVLSTEWVITIDRLVEYIGEEAAKPILEEVIKNEKQLAEWKAYNLVQTTPTYDNLKSQGKWLKMSVDTKHFDSNFKEHLLSALSNNINISEKLDGLVINSDNYHGINHIQNTEQKTIQCIHIDPPYNTATSGFLYKNTYEHSSWLSMMDNRLRISLDLLKDTASYHVHIDENEYERLHSLFNNYNLYNAGPIIWDKRNPMNGGSGVATQHEYIIWRTLDNHIIHARNKNILEMLKKVDELIESEGDLNDSVRKKFSSWVNSNKSLSGGEKAYRYIDDNGRLYQSVSLRAPEPRADEKFHQPLIHPDTKKPCAMPPNGFSRTPETLKEMMNNSEILFGKDETTQPRQKVYLKETTKRQLSSLIQDGKKGKADTKPLGLDFPYCHPTSLYIELIGASNVENSDTVLDFFAGSGTTFHSVQLLNKEDKLTRKCILIEQGHYVSTIINPRVKKIAYSFDWKDGKPKDGSMNGLGVFFKYQRLEQYEEALENIAFNASKDATQKALEFEQYIPKYFLEFETKGSQTLVNTAAMQDPWDYKLKVWDGFTYDNEQAVDLVETFNYLIGLHMQKCITKELSDKKYQFVYGNNNANKNILVVWRSVKDWSMEDFKADAVALKTELKAFEYDLLYINDQAHIESYQPIEEVFKNKMLS
ncbi:site-specific DNA-methyltransferase [Flagellimonas lutimaris]|uniref:site-specific DNA-methyltransferase (adenine-specific) n=1 Tax=Flagellimonas lutimaris TaxID=475082 RepID=A0A3A1N4C8_9FLAO|nr:site-specific DNA-methyltransferase [Allomuricauda lutimaris]RIV31552.1 site-specific DNA-methyltransferase [Allomuricauda lutimaris]